MIVGRLRGLYGPNPSMTDASGARGGAHFTTYLHAIVYNPINLMYGAGESLFGRRYSIFLAQV